MLVTCPNCAAGYDVPENLLSGGGRKLKCARCATQFLAAGAEVVPLVEPILDAPVPIPVEPPPLRAPVLAEKPPQSTPRRDHSALLQVACAMLAWVASLGAAGGLSWAVIDQREAVMQAWQPSQRAYLALGLATPRHLNGAAASAPTEAREVPATSPRESHPD
jgi:predicted Zn finger-like uncharacterized protein